MVTGTSGGDASAKDRSARVRTDHVVVHLEDSALDAELVAARLEIDGLECRLVRVETRDAFVDALRNGPVHAIISDYALPLFDGESALNVAQALCPDVPFVFVSGAIGEERAIELMRRGATDYVLKNRLERLAPAVRRALREAEDRAARRTNAERTERLQHLATALATVTTPADVMRAGLAAAVPAVGAGQGGAWLPAPYGRALELAASVGYDAAARISFACIATDADMPVALCARTHTPVWLDTQAKYAEAFPRMAASYVAPLDEFAVACLPVAVDARLLGVIAFTFEGPRAFEPTEQDLLSAIARLCAQALDRARLFELERNARDRLAVLADASEVLGRSLDYEATLQAVIGLALPRLADFAFFDVISDKGEMRRLVRVRDESQADALRDTVPPVLSEPTEITLSALATGRTGLYPEIDETWLSRVHASPEYTALVRRFEVTSMLSVPLNLQRGTIGALTLFFARSGRRHSEDDAQLAEEIARRAAVAVDNARLFELANIERTRAEEANHAKDLFLSTLSHELRTPLNAILGWTRMLRGGTLPEAKRERALETIDRNARAQVALIEDILDVSRIATGKLRLNVVPIDIAQAVDGALDTVRPASEAKGVELSAKIEDDIGTVQGDATRLQQVIWNLVSNAVKFTPRGGRVDVHVGRGDGAVEVVVRDSGEGIDPSFLPHVFEVFRQADASSTRRHGGLGLGLAIVRHLVELHGGTIHADSEGRGKGATFTVLLPVAVPRANGASVTARAVVARPSVALECPAELMGTRILVVDDEPDARELIESVLVHCRAHVFTASSAADALAEIRRNPPDLLVSDIGMPGEDGYALIRSVRSLSAMQGGRLAAIALTAFARPEDRARVLEAGFDDHVAKPVEPQTLVVALANLVGKLSSIPPD